MTAQELLQTLTDARDAYYNGSPIMTDAEFDALEDDLRAADPNSPFFSNVGAAVPAVSGWAKVKHLVPMSSLNKAQDESDMASWYGSVCGAGHTESVLVMEKLDGISISLRYENSKLTQAVTRGDGVIGEDIFRNVKLMQGVPHYLPEPGKDIHVRGEIVCLKSDFAQHFPGESNPRNTASGTAKRQSDPTPCKHLTVIAFDLVDDGPVQLKEKRDEFLILESYGFKLPNGNDFTKLSTVFSLYSLYVDTKRDELDYDIDGLVVCLNNNAAWEAAGEKNHRPAGSIAYKFPHESTKTTLRNIVWQVGNSGRVTPVAEFDSVPLAGANVRRASLHNVSNIKRIAAAYGDCHGIGVGDTIMVSRRNDVIPYVESLVSTMNPSHSFSDLHPSVCPECKATLTFEGEYLICPNTLSCPAQISGAIKRWVKKVGILDLGETVIEAMCESGMISDTADLYTVEEDALSALELSGRRVGSSATTILANLHAKKELPLHVLLGSIGIHLMGRSMCKKIIDAGYDNLDKVAAASVEDLAAIPAMGQTKAESFVNGFKQSIGLISKLMMVGITIKAPSNGALKGKTICMTGFRDTDMHTAIEEAGGTVRSSVSKNLDYLVCKDPNSTSGKAKKARAQGTAIIGVSDMWNVLA
jgi:DNA ligase (NAD+)